MDHNIILDSYFISPSLVAYAVHVCPLVIIIESFTWIK